MNSPLSPAERALMRRIGALGGHARAANTSKKRLSEIGKIGAKARYAKKRNGTKR